MRSQKPDSALYSSVKRTEATAIMNSTMRSNGIATHVKRDSFNASTYASQIIGDKGPLRDKSGSVIAGSTNQGAVAAKL